MDENELTTVLTLMKLILLGLLRIHVTFSTLSCFNEDWQTISWFKAFLPAYENVSRQTLTTDAAV